jgi:hypothetical protein
MAFLEAPPGFEPGIRVLQTHALPLGYSALVLWSGLRGSNSLPPPWQGGALPDELNPHILFIFKMNRFILNVVPPVGIEPTTRGFSVLCSTD